MAELFFALVLILPVPVTLALVWRTGAQFELSKGLRYWAIVALLLEGESALASLIRSVAAIRQVLIDISHYHGVTVAERIAEWARESNDLRGLATVLIAAIAECALLCFLVVLCSPRVSATTRKFSDLVVDIAKVSMIVTALFFLFGVAGVIIVATGPYRRGSPLQSMARSLPSLISVAYPMVITGVVSKAFSAAAVREEDIVPEGQAGDDGEVVA